MLRCWRGPGYGRSARGWTSGATTVRWVGDGISKQCTALRSTVHHVSITDNFDVASSSDDSNRFRYGIHN